jgi:xanthine dehydrogenase YagR molybdenum-binding subunit
VGGAFGSGLRPQYQVALAVMAAVHLRRSVRVGLTRQQMFGLGHRPATWQRVTIGAARDGKLKSLQHTAIGETSRYEDYSEMVTNWSGLLYACDNVKVEHKVVPLDESTPCDMRAPGAAWGVYALECAMDELAVKLNVDPLDLRLNNYAERDANQDLPFSSKELRACYREGAERFGWYKSRPQPRTIRDGSTLIGYGMATGAWEAQQRTASVKAVFSADCRLQVSSATADIGTGTYTIMTQIAADVFGLPLEAVTFQLGDSQLSKSPVQGGSWTTATIGAAVKAACEKLGDELFKAAKKIEGSPLAEAKRSDVDLRDGRLLLRKDSGRAIALRDVLRDTGNEAIEAEATTRISRERAKYACYTHSAIFAEVHVDEDFCTVQVPRVVTAVACGRVLNPKTARSQVQGGIVWGISMALEEESVFDDIFGRCMTHNLADYHFAVNADVRDIDVIFVEEHDDVVNPLGAKGMGEIGVVGVAAAIANGVYQATGQRIRELPITLDKLYDGLPS